MYDSLKKEIKIDIVLNEFQIAKDKLDKVLKDDVLDPELWLMYEMCHLKIQNISEIVNFESDSLFEDYAMIKTLELADDEMRNELNKYRNIIVNKKFNKLSNDFCSALEKANLHEAVKVSKKAYIEKNSLMISHFYYSIKSEYEYYKNRCDDYFSWCDDKNKYQEYLRKKRELEKEAKFYRSIYEKSEHYSDLNRAKDAENKLQWLDIENMGIESRVKNEKTYPILEYQTFYNSLVCYYKKAMDNLFCDYNDAAVMAIDGFFSCDLGNNNVNLSFMIENHEQYKQHKLLMQEKINKNIYMKWFKYWSKFNDFLLKIKLAVKHLKENVSNSFVAGILNKEVKKTLFGYKLISLDSKIGVDLTRYIKLSIDSDENDKNMYIYNNGNSVTEHITAGHYEDLTKIPVKTPMSGNIIDVKVCVGQKVEKDDVLLILEAMKLENEIIAPVSGTIKSIYVSQGERVDTHHLLLEIIPN